MSYIKTTWVTGDTITATKMNKIEEGIETAGTVTILTDTNGTLNKTVDEIYQLLSTGAIVLIFIDDNYPNSNCIVKLGRINVISENYGGFIIYLDSNDYYYASTVNDYPVKNQTSSTSVE